MKNGLEIVLDDFHQVFRSCGENPELATEFQEFFKLYKEMTRSLHIIITTRQMLPSGFLLSMSRINIQELVLQGMEPNDFKNILESVNLDYEDALIEKIHKSFF